MKKQYCYYTQFISSIIYVQKDLNLRKKLLVPLLKYAKGELPFLLELFKMLKSVGCKEIGFVDVSRAYEKAKLQVDSIKAAWKKLYQNEIRRNDDIHIMLLGRPYTVLSPAMNSSIPDIIERTGVKTFYMDMITERLKVILKAEELIKTIKWKFASKILSAAEFVAKTENGYPVLITSFKCAPDSFVIEYFKAILNSYQKPYLILQLDEHDSTVGYETRIEAAIRAFRNHHDRKKSMTENGISEVINETFPVDRKDAKIINETWNDYIKSLVRETSQILKIHNIDFKHFSSRIQQLEIQENHMESSIFEGAKKLKDKILLLPSWDTYVGPLLEAVLQNSGIEAHLVPGSYDSIQRSLSWNTGQCLPLNIIVQNAVDYIEMNHLNPADTALWIMKTNLSCNLSMFPHYMKKLMADYGHGMEKSTVYLGDIKFTDFSLQTAINAYLAYMFGGYIRKIGCSIRPYEKYNGITDEIIHKSLDKLYNAFRFGTAKEQILENIMDEFESIETVQKECSKVAVFGDLYVRDNDLMNQNLIQFIEQIGGQVITPPYSEYMKIVVGPFTERIFREGKYFDYLTIKFLKSLIPLIEDKYKKYFRRYNGKGHMATRNETDNWLNHFGLNILHKGESLENVLKIQSLVKEHPDLDLFIQTNPSYCCPSLVTESMTSGIEEITGVPVVTIEYDGTATSKNDIVIPYLKYRKKHHFVMGS